MNYLTNNSDYVQKFNTFKYFIKLIFIYEINLNYIQDYNAFILFA